MSLPYLPTIFKDIIERTNTELLDKDPDGKFARFGYGLYSQVWKDVVTPNKPKDKLPLVWLVMNFDEDVNPDPQKAVDIPGIELVLTMETEPNYSQAQRDEKIYEPILFPLYDELIKQIKATPEFGKPTDQQLRHTRRIRPYWGGGEGEGGHNTQNLFKTFVDAIQIVKMKLSVKPPICKPNF